jgi:hypothetical protein
VIEYRGKIAQSVRDAVEAIGEDKVIAVEAQRRSWDEWSGIVYTVDLQPGWMNPANDTHSYNEVRAELLALMAACPPVPCSGDCSSCESESDWGD